MSLSKDQAQFYQQTLEMTRKQIDDLNDQIDAAYRDKYRRYGPSIIGGVVNPGAGAATIRLVPRSSAS